MMIKENEQQRLAAHLPETQLHTTASSGLSRKEARSRYKRNGANTLFDAKQASLIEHFRPFLTDPALLLLCFFSLFAIGFSSRFAGLSALLVLLCLVLWILRVLRLRGRQEDELAAYRMPMVTVLREGKPCRISARRLVPEDVILLRAGDIVPADCRLMAQESLRVLTLYRNEQGKLLFAELPKQTEESSDYRETLDAPFVANILYGGSEVLEGSATASIVATGKETYLGSLDGLRLPAERGEESAPIYVKHLNGFLRVFGIFYFVLFLPLAVIGFFTASQAVGLASLLLSIAALMAGSSYPFALLHFQSIERATRTELFRSGTILKSNQAGERLSLLTDVAVLGHVGALDGSQILSLIEKYRKNQLRACFFLSGKESAELAALEKDGLLSLCLFRSRVNGLSELLASFDRYRILIGFSDDEILWLLSALKKQGRRIAVMGKTADDVPLMRNAFLSVGCSAIPYHHRTFREDLLECALLKPEVQNNRAAEALRRHADLLVPPANEQGGGLLALLSAIAAARGVHLRMRLLFAFLCAVQIPTLLTTILSVLTGRGLMTGAEILYLSMLVPTVGAVMLALIPLPQKRLQRPIAFSVDQMKRSLTDPELAFPPLIAASAVSVYAIVLCFCRLLTAEMCSAYLFASCLLLALASFFSLLWREGIKPPLLVCLIFSAVLLLPVLILALCAVLIPGFGTIVPLGAWNVFTLSALPAAPLICLLTQPLFRKAIKKK